MRDIAQAVGVTAMTVSLALRNDPSISAARREQIQQAAKAMGYEPDPMLAALAHYRHTRSSKPLQAALAWLNFWPEPKKLRAIPLFDANWQGVEAAAGALGYRVEEFICRDLSPERLKNILVTRGIRGILLPPQRPPIDKESFDFDWSRFAAIRIGRSVPYPTVHVVTRSQAHDALLAFHKIQEKGYRRTGFVSSRTIHFYGLFDAGFLKAQAQLPTQDRLPMLVLDDWPEATPKVLEAIAAWMKQNQPDAILTTEGNMKMLLKAAGYRVPEDVALAATSVSNSDADAGIYENPGEVGRTVVKTLAALLQRNEFGIPEFPQDILVRGKWEDGATLPDRA
jgi:LacI family transcriptional regulator